MKNVILYLISGWLSTKASGGSVVISKFSLRKGDENCVMGLINKQPLPSALSSDINEYLQILPMKID